MDLLKITNHATSGKLEGFQSLNTTVLKNSYCSKMRLTDSVCKSCYAATMEKRFAGLRNNIEHNSELLSSKIIERDQLPFINAAVFRFHSTGELINETHFLNFLNIALKNPHCNFSLWTKRKGLVKRVLSGTDKPKNLKLIHSTSKLNVRLPRLPPGFDKTFSVYSKGTSEGINCVGKCKDCMLCYTDNETTDIREVLK